VNGQTQLLRLLSWLSPAFPVGAFAYSHGLEQAINDGAVTDRAGLIDWLTDLLERGSGWNDAVLLAEAWRTADSDGCAGAAELAVAMAGSRERHMETTLQGEAFVAAVAAWTPIGRGNRQQDLPYPVAVGLAAARGGVGLDAALAAYLHAFTANLVQAALRLVPLGQGDGVATLAAMEPVILDRAARAALSTLDDLGGCAVLSDIASMKHEILYSRVFRS
jgi:urease accessory protein